MKSQLGGTNKIVRVPLNDKAIVNPTLLSKRSGIKLEERSAIERSHTRGLVLLP